ncbi:MAG: plasmid pRiA4b ORF-3 family protein [Actinomycetales bacterium]
MTSTHPNGRAVVIGSARQDGHLSKRKKSQSRRPGGTQSSTAEGTEPDNLGAELARQLLASGLTPQEILAAVFSSHEGLGSALDGLGPTAPTLLPVPDQPVVFRLRLDLDDVRPPIWRRLDLAGDLSLPEVHQAIVESMGWSDTHLHQFTMGPGARDRQVQAFVNDWDASQGEIPPGGILEQDVRLDQVVAGVGDRLFHDYDFGDGWQHTLKVEKVLAAQSGAPRAVCLTGRRAAPPEDCGGVGGYEDILAMLSGEPLDYRDPEELRDWLPAGYDPAHFDLAEVNSLLAGLGNTSSVAGSRGRARAGAGPGSGRHPAVTALASKLPPRVRARLNGLMSELVAEDLTDDEVAYLCRGLQALLALVGEEGVNLTGAGYLKPAHVEGLVQALGLTGRLYGKANREENVLLVTSLRKVATSAKLIRKSKGRLVLSPAGRKLLPDSHLWADARPLLAQVLGALPTAKDEAGSDASVVWMLATALEMPLEERAELGVHLLSEAGWQLDGGQPLDRRAVAWQFQTARNDADALDVDQAVRAYSQGRPVALRKALTLVLLGDVDRVAEAVTG